MKKQYTVTVLLSLTFCIGKVTGLMNSHGHVHFLADPLDLQERSF